MKNGGRKEDKQESHLSKSLSMVLLLTLPQLGSCLSLLGLSLSIQQLLLQLRHLSFQASCLVSCCLLLLNQLL